MVTVCSLIASNTMRPQRSAAVAVVSWAWATEGYARGNAAETSHVYGAKLTR